MNQQDLTQKLAVSGGQVTLSVGTLTPAVDAFLVAYNNGQPIVISGAATQTDATGALVITGQSSFLDRPNLPVTATFSADAAGEVHALIRYQLRDSNPNPGAAAWVFSNSFPGLPSVVNYATPLPASFVPGAFDIKAGQKPFLDSLLLFDTAAVLATHAGTDPALGAPLQPGINIVSHLRPMGMLGVLESALGTDPTLVLYGVVRLAQANEVTTPLQPLEHPWDRLAAGSQLTPAPGIYLQAALDARFQLGTVLFHDALFHVYSPVSSDAMALNPSFGPLHGYTGTLDIPSAGVSIAMGADMQWNAPEALLYGKVAGATLGKLASLADAAGTSDLLSQLPSDLQSAVGGLGNLALTYVALDVCVLGGAPAVRGFYCTVGFPGLQWKVWNDDLVVESLTCRFAVRDPFGTTSILSSGPSFSVTVCGTLDVAGAVLDVQASNDRGFTVWAATRSKLAVPLDTLIKAHAPGLPVPSALTVDSLSATVAPGQDYSMSALMADAPNPWVIPVGKGSLTVSDVALNFDYPSGGPATGSFSGRIAFAGLVLRMAYAVPGSFFIRGDLPPMKLSHVIATLCDQTVSLPPGFDLPFDDSSIVIQDQQGALSFQLLTQIAGLGVLVFEACGGGGGKWGFALGLDLSASTLSTVPGLGALGKMEQALHLQKLLLIVSSIDQPGFQLPDTAQFNNPLLATTKVALPAGGGVVAGLNAFGQWTLDASNSQHKMLMSLLGISGTLAVTIQIKTDPANGTRLFFGGNGKLQGNAFAYQLGVGLSSGTPSLFLTGTLTVSIHGQRQTFAVTTLFVPTGAFLSASMTGTKPVDCGWFKLSNLGIAVGVDLAGLPSLGVTATIDVKSFQSSIAVFVDSAVPTQSLFAGSVSNLTLADVVSTLLGGAVTSSIDDVLSSVALKGTQQFTIPLASADDLNALRFDKVSAAFGTNATIPSQSSQLLLSSDAASKTWHLTDLTTMRHYQLKQGASAIKVSLEPQFYCAPQATTIGTQVFPQGFYINAAVAFFGFKAQATVDISPSRGISANAQMSKIVLGDANLFCLRAAQGAGGPQLSLSTYQDATQTDPRMAAPHFLINGSLTFLGATASAYVSATKSGLDFQVTLSPASGMALSVSGSFDSPTHFGASGTVTFDLEGTIDLGALGTMAISLPGASLTVTAAVQGSTASASVSGSLSVAHHTYSINLTLDVTKAQAAQIPGKVKSQITSLATALYADMNAWMSDVKAGFLSLAGGAKQFGATMAQTFHQTADQVGAFAKSTMGYAANDVSQALAGAGATASQAGQVLQNLYGDSATVTNALESAFTNTHADYTYGVHADTPAVPGINTPHSDSGHADSHSGHTDLHWDTWPKHSHTDGPAAHWDTHVHTDVGHVDTRIPHGDTTPHTDTTV